MSTASRLSEAAPSSLSLSAIGGALPQISYYAQQGVVPIGVQSQQQQQQHQQPQQQVVYGGGVSSTSTSANLLMSPPQQSEMRPTDAQMTSQGTVYPKRIFVGGIPAQTTEADLKLYFSQYGSVTETKIIQDRAGVSKGYGFVTFESADEVNKILAKDQQETLIFKDRKLNLGPAIRKNQLTQPGQPAAAPLIMYAQNSVPINSEGGQTIMLVPPMQMADGGYGSYQTAVPMLAAPGGQAFYLQQPTYFMPQQQIPTNAINAIQVPAAFQAQQQPQHHVHHQPTNALATPQPQPQQQYQYRATPQSPPTPGGYPLTPVNCHYTPGGPTASTDFYGADYEPIQSNTTEDNTSTWGSLSWGSQVAAYPATSDVTPTGGLNLNRELDVAADPFTIPEAPTSAVHEIKSEPVSVQQSAVKSSGSGYVSSTSSNVSLYNSCNGPASISSTANNNNNANEPNQNESFSGSYHKSGSVNGGNNSNGSAAMEKFPRLYQLTNLLKKAKN